MIRSERRILTTHCGSLPRPRSLTDLMIRRENGQSIDQGEFERQSEQAVTDVIEKQIEAGIDIGNNGEEPRPTFATYVTQRMSGFAGKQARPPWPDFVEFPDFAELWMQKSAGLKMTEMFNTPQAVAEVEYGDLAAAQHEYEQFLRCSDRASRKFTERFMTAPSPGILARILLNAHYDSHDSYVTALARQMKKEYELVHSKGLLLQIDAPDLAMDYAWSFRDAPMREYHKAMESNVAAINMATENIPADRIRLHVCWANIEAPHIHDVELAEILPILYHAKVGALSVEMANPRHQHEYKAFKQYAPPDSMTIIPGVIDPKTNYVEHPEVVADRLLRVVDAVGDRTRVIAGVDCGFATMAGYEMVAESIVWLKLKSLREGADLASARLWN